MIDNKCQIYQFAPKDNRKALRDLVMRPQTQGQARKDNLAEKLN